MRKFVLMQVPSHQLDLLMSYLIRRGGGMGGTIWSEKRVLILGSGLKKGRKIA